ncbi:hypothetical protein [Butyrivibrio sp. NC2002]|uniref:hypothetical protein n=1 Tax=Butyrivibrio sp. NC2002 TaxID=1410610 RepID=UPI00055C016C|nr:hypothetical protein [Butyrivibrio sp. NC2002]
MDEKVIVNKKDYTYLNWSHVRSSSGTTGTFLKAEETIDGRKRYYKLSLFDSEKGIIGHECVNEIIVDRLLTILGVEHLEYKLIHGDVDIDGKAYDTWFCVSTDFKEKGESKSALDDYYQIQAEDGISRYDFCMENGWGKYIDTMLAVDFLILNRDRHGANIEILRDSKKRTLRIAPFFDHGLSLLYSCLSEAEIKDFDVMKDIPCHNFIGSRSTLENLALIKDKKKVFDKQLVKADKKKLFADLDGVITKAHMDKIWDMIYSRWCYYESL